MNKREIPSVHKILSVIATEICRTHDELKFFVNSFLTSLRSEKLLDLGIEKKNLSLEIDSLVPHVKEYIKRESPEGKAAINGSGIILHTGLGRAPMSKRAKESLLVGAGYNLVQADRAYGDRCIRESLIRDILSHIGNAEDTTVVNNNAAATFLMLRALTKGKEVIISRGQLVEIGGSYRMPDIMQESGCIMKEVGTTNKTHLKDYENAITQSTGAFLYVHQSNFKIQGFSSQPTILELCALGKKHNIPVLADLGSGALISLEKFNLPHEHTLKEIMHAGITACCFSGDKLIGGPQAGIICGSHEVIEKIRKDSFSRMFRVCKLTLRSLEATLLDFLDDSSLQNIPLYSFLSTPVSNLWERAKKVQNALQKKYKIETVHTKAYMGGGATPEESLDSIALSITFENQQGAQRFSEKLRFSVPAVLSRAHNTQVLIDFKAIDPSQDEVLQRVLNQL